MEEKLMIYAAIAINFISMIYAEGQVKLDIGTAFNESCKKNKKTWIIEPSVIQIPDDVNKMSDNPTELCKFLLDVNDYKVVELKTVFYAFKIYNNADSYPFMSEQEVIYLLGNMSKAFSSFRSKEIKLAIKDKKLFYPLHEKYWDLICPIPPNNGLTLDISTLPLESKSFISDFGTSIFVSDVVKQIDANLKSLDKCTTDGTTAGLNGDLGDEYALITYFDNTKKRNEYLPITSHKSMTYQQFSPGFDLPKFRSGGKRVNTSYVFKLKPLEVFSESTGFSHITQKDELPHYSRYAIYHEEYADIDNLNKAIADISGFSISKVEGQKKFYISFPKMQVVDDVFDISRQMRRALPKTIIRFYDAYVQNRINPTEKSSPYSKISARIPHIQKELSIACVDSFKSDSEVVFKEVDPEFKDCVFNYIFSNSYKGLFKFYARNPPTFSKNPPTGRIVIKMGGRNARGTVYSIETLGDENSGYAFSIVR